MNKLIVTTLLIVAWFAALQFPAVSAQDGTAGDSEQADSQDVEATVSLTDKQARLADKYRRLEELLFKMEEFERDTNPTRAKLLREALGHGREKGIQLQLDALARRLADEQYKLAIDGQAQVKTDLAALLELLQKEDRARRNASEQARIKGYIKELDRLIRKERSLQGRTEGGSDTEGLAKEQGDLSERTGDLADEIRENEEQAGESQASEPSENEGQPNEGQPSEGEPQEGEPSEGRPSEGQPPEGQPSEGQPQEGQPQQGESGESGQQQPQQENPARQQIEQAQQKMRDAQEQLEKAERENAVKDQEEARRLLEQAKAELEEILRQLREEEIERTLALLEARFRKILKMQETVYDDTVSLDKSNTAGDDSTVPARAAKLSFEQKKIVVEADRALTLLREEGSSIAFPEVVEQIRDDMQQVTDRLAEVQTGTITQGIEEDIIVMIKEMIEALQQAQREQEQRQQEGQPQQGQPQDPGLVDIIAELRMIKAMQLRVNSRTTRYADLLENPEDLVGQATAADLQQAIIKMGEREQQCQRITRDIVLGKNK